MKPSFAIVGAGRVGCALAAALYAHGYPLTGVYSRSEQSAMALAQRFNAPVLGNPGEVTQQADMIFITTPDGVIAQVAAAMAVQGGFRPGQFVYHTCGAMSADILLPARQQGAYIGSLHPLQSFASGGENCVQGIFFAIDGDPEAVARSQLIVRELQGHSFIVPDKDRAIYHAAACIASNYLVSLVHWATGLYRRFGLSEQEAMAALKPLLAGTFANLEKFGTVDALTGPISRGDDDTIAKHVQALSEAAPLEQNLYAFLGLYTTQVALAKGSIDQEKAGQLAIALDSLISPRLRDE